MAGRPRRFGTGQMPGSQIVRIGPEEAERLVKLQANIATQRKAADEEFRMHLANRLGAQRLPGPEGARRPPVEVLDKSAAERAEQVRKRIGGRK